MAIAGALVLPLNLLSSCLFKDTEDRLALCVLTVICVLVSAFVCCEAPYDYSSTQYVAGCIVLFGALNANEGTIMCLRLVLFINLDVIWYINAEMCFRSHG